MNDLNHQPTPKRRRWWLGIVFALLGILVVMAVALLSSSSAPPYAFLKGAHLSWASETIGPAMIGGQIYVRTSDYITDQSFAKTTAIAVAELAKEGYTVAERGRDHVMILQPSTSSYVTLYRNGYWTTILISEMRAPTTVDRARIWLKSILPKQPRQHGDTPDPR